MKDEYGRQMHSEKYLEMTFSNGKLQRTVSQFAEGIPSAVQARLAAAKSGTKKPAAKARSAKTFRVASGKDEKNCAPMIAASEP